MGLADSGWGPGGRPDKLGAESRAPVSCVGSGRSWEAPPHRGAGPRQTLGKAEDQGNKPSRPEAKPLWPPRRAEDGSLVFEAKLGGGTPVSAEPIWRARPWFPRRGVGP